MRRRVAIGSDTVTKLDGLEAASERVATEVARVYQTLRSDARSVS